MGIPANVVKTTLVWASADGEVANSSVWMQGAAPTSDSALATWLAQFVTILEGTPAYINAMRSLVELDTVLTSVKAYSYPAGGPIAAHVASQGLASGHTGTGTNPHPLQTSAVVTLRTALQGRRNRGRMYFPANGCAMAGNRFSSTPMATLATQIGALFTGLNASLLPLGTVVVVSQAATATHPVTSVSTDTRPDIQRRRADKQPIGIVTTQAV